MKILLIACKVFVKLDLFKTGTAYNFYIEGRVLYYFSVEYAVVSKIKVTTPVLLFSFFTHNSSNLTNEHRNQKYGQNIHLESCKTMPNCNTSYVLTFI